MELTTAEQAGINTGGHSQDTTDTSKAEQPDTVVATHNADMEHDQL